MKKLFLLLLPLFVISCVGSEQPYTNAEYVTGDRMYKVIEFGYKGHDYILFQRSGYTAGVVHNPDCHCFTDKK